MKIQQKKSAKIKATIWLLVRVELNIPIATNDDPNRIKPIYDVTVAP
jgi:hypothetical protein